MRRRGEHILCTFLSAVLLLSACGQRTRLMEQTDAIQSPIWQEQYDLGIRYLSNGNYEEAIIAFTAAIEIDPKQAPAYVGRGNAYVGLGGTEGNLTAAQVDYEKAIELDKTLAKAYLGLADIYIQQEQYEQALKILQEGLEQTGENQDIANGIAELDGKVTPDIPAKIEKAVSYNAYGGREFTQRNSYRDAGLLSSEELTMLRTAMDLTIANDMQGLYQLASHCIESSDKTPGDIVHILTKLDGYKVEFRIPSEKNNSVIIKVEFRPENGGGYCADITKDEIYGGWWSVWGSCLCTDWQWNGDVTEIHTETYWQTTETGHMKNSLKDGVFERKSVSLTDGYTSFSTYTYENGIWTEIDGTARELDDGLWTINFVVPRGGLDYLYW